MPGPGPAVFAVAIHLVPSADKATDVQFLPSNALVPQVIPPSAEVKIRPPLPALLTATNCNPSADEAMALMSWLSALLNQRAPPFVEMKTLFAAATARRVPSADIVACDADEKVYVCQLAPE